MARRYVFPDPNDRSPNAPSFIVSNVQVIGIYNQENPGEKMERVTEKVSSWFVSKAKKEFKWDTAHFAGNQCLLSVKMARKDVPE